MILNLTSDFSNTNKRATRIGIYSKGQIGNSIIQFNKLEKRNPPPCWFCCSYE